MIDPGKIKKIEDKEYRDAYLEAQIRLGIAYQIQALRAKYGDSQAEFADRVGKTQSVISRLESDSGRASIQTLIDIARSVDVALLVRFVDYAEFLTRVEDKSEAALQPDSIVETIARLSGKLHSASPSYGSQWSTPIRQPELAPKYPTFSGSQPSEQYRSLNMRILAGRDTQKTQGGDIAIWN